MATYSEIKNRQPELHECFFAFSTDQYNAGVKRTGVEGKKLFKGIGGLIGTQEGIQKLYDDYENIDKEIAANCDPQDVYNYEFGNHECDYTGSDTEAIKIVAATFGDERAKTVKRRYAYVKIEELKYN